MRLEDEGKWCPLIKENCVGRKCHFFIGLMGQNPNTGQPVNEYFCSIAALPMLLIENTQQVRQAGAAIESFRNNVERRADEAEQKTVEAIAAIKDRIREPDHLSVRSVPTLEGRRT